MNIRSNERGVMNILLVPLILCSLLFIGAISFAVWAFGQYQDFKNNTDQKISVAVESANKSTQKIDAKTYAEAAKNPFKTYTGPEAFGSVVVQYPKTWSAYIDTTNSSTPLDGYLQPDVVPGINDQTATYALRVQVVQQSYSSVLAQFNSLVKNGKVTTTPYQLAKVPGVGGIGMRIDGQITTTKQGSMVIFKLRDKTLKIWTESLGDLADFNGIILPNISFSP